MEDGVRNVRGVVAMVEMAILMKERKVRVRNEEEERVI